jgi:hypothetical protein
MYIAVPTSLTAAALPPNMAAELLAVLLRVREAPSQNIGPETVYTEWSVLWFPPFFHEMLG